MKDIPSKKDIPGHGIGMDDGGSNIMPEDLLSPSSVLKTPSVRSTSVE